MGGVGGGIRVPIDSGATGIYADAEAICWALYDLPCNHLGTPSVCLETYNHLIDQFSAWRCLPQLEASFDCLATHRLTCEPDMSEPAIPEDCLDEEASASACATRL